MYDPNIIVVSIFFSIIPMFRVLGLGKIIIIITIITIMSNTIITITIIIITIIITTMSNPKP